MKPIAIFYHCLFYLDNKLLPQACQIVSQQMLDLYDCGLLSAASHFQVGVNGGPESADVAQAMIPFAAVRSFHGLDCRNENCTLLEIEKWRGSHPGWHVLYFHSKGATKPPGDSFTGTWRNCMMRHNILNWKRCVADLERGYDAVGCHWMEPPATPDGQYIFAGTFWWAKSDYLLTLPSIMERERIKISGLGAFESRYESEVWIGNGPRKPKVMDYHGPGWNPSKVGTCAAS